MSTEEYFQMIINILIGLTMITLFLLFLYTIYGKDEQSRPASTRFLNLSERILSIGCMTVYFWYIFHKIR